MLAIENKEERTYTCLVERRVCMHELGVVLHSKIIILS